MTDLPPTVLQALGDAAATDLAHWLEVRLQEVSTTSALPISPFSARQKVNVLMLEKISNLLLADEPILEKMDDRWVWRVPIDLTLMARGRIGRVGEVIVDATYGNLTYDETLLAHIARTTEQLMIRYRAQHLD